jgi:hypothetical protein
VEEISAAEPAPQPHRKVKRWSRIVTQVLVIALFNCAAGAGAAEAYVDSVPLPGEPSAPQASVLYYRDGRTILARVGPTDLRVAVGDTGTDADAVNQLDTDPGEHRRGHRLPGAQPRTWELK